MSHAQLTIKQIHNLRKKQSAALKSLTIIGYLEGTSFLLLLCIAMPLKYMLDIPEGVKYIGMAHGILFIRPLAKVAEGIKIRRTFIVV